MAGLLRFTAVIPARYASTRLPGKPLADVGGKPMVVRVAEQARESGAASVWIATDHEDIVAAAKRYGFDAMMTRPDHASGTDRIAEAAAALGLAADDIVVNVQGDEPLMPSGLVTSVVHTLAQRTTASIATAAHPVRDATEFFNPNVVKVVCDHHGYALYFSRAPIPYARDAFAASRADLPEGLPALRHIGLYAYRVAFLSAYAKLAPAPVEGFEALEQLRALWHGHRIAVAIASEAPPAGVDTPEDLDRVRREFTGAR